MFCVVSYHHKIIVELGKYCFDTFTESPVSPYWRTPVFLIRPIWNFKSNIGCLKEIFLYLGAKITLVTKHHAVVIFPAYILEIMEVMNACRRHVIRMYDTAYAANCMELISIIVQPLRGAIPPVRGSIGIVTPLCNELAANITRFLLELGQGFAYVGRQMELKMPGGQTFVPDMIFYHTRLKSYIVCELKVVPFIPDFAGKLNFYVSAVDELMTQSDDNPTIGLLICKDDTVVEWSFRGMNQPLGVAEYQLKEFISEKAAKLLPSEAELQNIIDTYDEVSDD